MEKSKKAELFDGLAERRDKWRRLNSHYHNELRRLYTFMIPEGQRVLEVGCGTGDLLAQVRPSYGVGIDFSPEMIRIAREKYPELHFHVADVEGFNIDETFDYIILSDLIGHLHDVQKALCVLREVCASSTRLLLNFYNHLWEPFLKMGEILNLKTPVPLQNWLAMADVENLLYLSGFETVTRSYRLLTPYNIPLVSFVIDRFFAKLPILRRFCLVQFVVARLQPVCPSDWQKCYSCSVIIPTRNEAGNIERALAHTPDMGKWTELIFVDGSSTDGTVEEIEKGIAKYGATRRIKLIHQRDGRGKGDAVRKGFDAAEGDILLILDSDLTVPPEDLLKFYEAIATGRGEFINGCRLVYPMEKEAMRFLNQIANKMFGVLFSWLLEQRIKDTLCGTKVLFRRDYELIRSNRSYFGDFDPFGDFDLLFGAAKLNLRIVDLPIRYLERTYGNIKIRRFRHGLLLMRMCAVAFRRLKLQ
jgi:ubiquinone/menaquinone biosynthesis C-methylase UbiE